MSSNSKDNKENVNQKHKNESKESKSKEENGFKSSQEENESQKIPKIFLNKLNAKESLVNNNEENAERNKLIEDINNSMKLLDIDPNVDEIIEYDENEFMYMRNDPVYMEINGYIVGEQLGEGMFAFVKEFVQKNSCKRFAAKIMNKERIVRKGPNFVENIKLEINLVRKLNHNNVIKILDMFTDNVNHYLITEYCYAVLSEYLSGEPPKKLPISQSHRYFCQLIEGLDYLHGIGIIHRDIKPSNLLINNSNQIKITDFGVCYILDRFDSSDRLTSIEGTPYYTPPEVFKEDFSEYSGTKFDIWSSGITLYQMISGCLPFDDKNSSFFDNILEKDIEYPKEILKDKQLMQLLNEIFIKDFNKRIAIDGIKRHPWFNLKRSHNDFSSLPPKASGDLYRSLTVLPYIQSYLYPTDFQNEDLLVSRQEFEASNDRTPNIRSNRLKKRRSVRKKIVTPFRRLVRLGLSMTDD